MTRSRIRGARTILAFGLVVALGTIAVAQGPSYDLTGEWVVSQKGSWFDQPETYRLEKAPSDVLSMNVYKVGGEKWPNTKFRFLPSGELKGYSEAGVPGVTARKIDVNPKTGRIEWDDGSVFTRTSGAGGYVGCQPTFDGEWRDWGANVGAKRGTPPAGTEGKWGTWSLKQNGNTVTGTVPKFGERFGPASITATVSGQTLTGTWTAPGANGKLTLTRTADNCAMTGAYSVDQPPGESGGTIGRPGDNLNPSAGQGGGNPWETSEGQACFEKWIAETTQKLNTTDLSHEMNANKPYRFDQYGHLLNKFVTQPNAPDAWEANGRNKYKYMWEYWNTDNTGGQWRGTGPDGFGSDGGVLKKAGVPALRDYVRNCTPGSTPGSTREPPLGDGMMLWAPDYQVRKGDRVGVKVYLINAKDVRNLDFSIDFNSGLVSFVGQPVRGVVVTELNQFNLERPGLLDFNFARLTPFTQRGHAEVAGFTFEGTNVGRTPLKLSLSPGNKLPLTLIDGSIQVYEGSRPPGTQWPPPVTQPPGTGWEPTCSNTGRQTINDAQCCLKMGVKLIPPNLVMDQNGDSVVDSNDAVIIMDRLAARGEYRPSPR